MFSCESDFDGNDFNKAITTIENSTRKFWEKFNSTTERINGTFYGQGIGLNATANFNATDGIIKKILTGTELVLSLDLSLEIDNVKLSTTTVVKNVDESDFHEPDNITICFEKSKDCYNLLDLDAKDAMILAFALPDPSEVAIYVNDLKVQDVKIEGKISSLVSKLLNDEGLDIKLTVKAHAASDLKFNVELHGNTKKDDIKKLDNDNEFFDGGILNGLTQVKGQICIGTECANFKECSDDLCNDHHEEMNPTTIKSTIKINQTNIQTNSQTHNQTHNQPNNQTNNQTNIQTNSQTHNQTHNQPNNQANNQTNNQTKIPKENNNKNSTITDTTTITSKPDKNQTARGFGYFCAVVIIFVLGGLVFYYYRKKRNGAMASRSEYAELTATHI